MAINSDLNIHELLICVNVLIHKEGKYLTLLRSPLKKQLPNHIAAVGGKLDNGEDPYIGALREAKEETGLDIKNLKLLSILTEMVDHIPKYGGKNWMIFYFEAEYESGELIPTDEGELKWLTPLEIVQYPIFPSFKKIIEHTIINKNGPLFAHFHYDDDSNIIKETLSFCRK